jgi:hypothetical protein
VSKEDMQFQALRYNMKCIETSDIENIGWNELWKEIVRLNCSSAGKLYHEKLEEEVEQSSVCGCCCIMGTVLVCLGAKVPPTYIAGTQQIKGWRDPTQSGD